MTMTRSSTERASNAAHPCTDRYGGVRTVLIEYAVLCAGRRARERDILPPSLEYVVGFNRRTDSCFDGTKNSKANGKQRTFVASRWSVRPGSEGAFVFQTTFPTLRKKRTVVPVSLIFIAPIQVGIYVVCIYKYISVFIVSWQCVCGNTAIERLRIVFNEWSKSY